MELDQLIEIIRQLLNGSPTPLSTPAISNAVRQMYGQPQSGQRMVSGVGSVYDNRGFPVNPQPPQREYPVRYITPPKGNVYDNRNFPTNPQPQLRETPGARQPIRSNVYDDPRTTPGFVSPPPKSNVYADNRNFPLPLQQPLREYQTRGFAPMRPTPPAQVMPPQPLYPMPMRPIEPIRQPERPLPPQQISNPQQTGKPQVGYTMRPDYYTPGFSSNPYTPNVNRQPLSVT